MAIATESFNKADSTILGPDQVWTEFGVNSSVVSNQWAASGSGARARMDVDFGLDHYAEGVVTAYNADHSADIHVRWNPASDSSYTFRVRNSGTLNTFRFFQNANGAFTQVGASVIATAPLVPFTMRCEATDSGGTVTLKGFINGVEVISRTDSTSPLQAGHTRTGLGAENFSPTFTSFEAGDLSVPDALTCTDKTDQTIFQRDAGATTKALTFAGTYAGTIPSSIEIKIVLDSDGSTVQDWTALSSATIASNAWSGMLSVPQSGDWYNFLVRSKNGGGSVLITTAQTTNKWGVGIVVGLLGQSNMEKMTSVVASPNASDDATRQYTDAGGWAVVGGNGATVLANLLHDSTGVLIGLLQFGVSSSSLAVWLADSGQIYSNFVEGMTAAGGACEFVLWMHGESDGQDGTTKATYKDGMDTLYARILSDAGRSTSTLKFGMALVGTATGTATDATHDAIRQAQLEWASETTGAFFAASAVDLVRIDSFHWSAPYYERMGRRYAQAILFQLGDVPFGADGPRALSASRTLGSADITIAITHNGGMSLGELDGSTDGGSITGFQVSTDDFASLLTISSTAFSGNNVVLTLSAIPADETTVKVRYQYGENPTVTNPVYANTTPQGDSIGLPLQPTLGALTAALDTYDEIGSGGCLVGSTAVVPAIVEEPEPPRTSIYPLIRFRVNLDFNATSGVPSTEHSQFNLGLQTIAVPGVGRVKHGDGFTLDGIDADYVRRNYRKIGRLYDDPRDTLEVLSIE